MADPILLDGALAEKNLEVKTANEYIYGNQFADFMGETNKSVIQVEHSESKGAGDRIFFSLMEALDPDAMILGDSQLEGNEQERVVREDSLTIDYVRNASIVRNVKRLGIRSRIEFLERAQPDLSAAHTQRLRNDLIDAAALTVSPVQGRIRFGALESNYNATLATGLATLDTTNDLLTVDLIRAVKRKAQDDSGVYSGGSANATRMITPSEVEGNLSSTSYKETYVMFVDLRSADDLKSDADYQGLRDDARQNLISMSFINKSLFVGMIENVMIYEMPKLERIGHDGAGDSSADVTHNLFCGAQAWGVGIGEAMSFETEHFDYKKDQAVAAETIRGQKVLAYSDGTNDIEAGMIHVMCATTV